VRTKRAPHDNIASLAAAKPLNTGLMELLFFSRRIIYHLLQSSTNDFSNGCQALMELFLMHIRCVVQE
jgi:hypothetical protein